MRRAFLTLLGIASLSHPALSLNAPWYYTHSQVRAAFEGGPIKVLELEQRDGHWVVPVSVSGPDATSVGAALATVLKQSLLGGSVQVEVRLPSGSIAQPVRASSSDVDSTIKTLRTALTGNVHLSGVFAFGPGVLVELKPEILHFYADNISDRHGMAHFPAAGLFADLLDMSRFPGVHVFFSYDSPPPAR